MWETISKRLIFPCLVVFSLPAVFEAANCSDEIGNYREVFNSSDVEELADSLMCPGSTQLVVDWYGEIEISRSLNIRNGGALNITGLEAAVIKGSGANRLFMVSGGSTLSLDSITIEGGRAPDEGCGGAISANESSHLNLHNCSFMNNMATGYGGAVYADNASLAIDGHSSYSDNAGDHGGAIYAKTGSATLDGTMVFQNNEASVQGGAMYFLQYNVTVSGHLVMSNNTSEALGGGIAVIHSPSAVLNSSMLLTNNTGSGGGALYVSQTEDMVLGGQWRLENNNASRGGGGAFLFADCTSVVARGDLSFAGNSANEYGGAIYMSATDIELDGSIKLTRNWAQNGGAISMSDAVFTFNEEVYMADNFAVFNGGGVYMSTDEHAASVAIFKGPAVFERNQAVKTGGAVSVRSGSILRATNVNFTANEVIQGNGGAIYAGAEVEVALTGASLVSNLAADVGGGMAALGAGDISIDSCLFCGNRAVDGGGFYNSEGFKAETHITESIFRGNHADVSGGGLFHSGKLEKLTGTVLQGNSAGQEGPAVMSIGSVKNMTGTTFANNTFFCPSGTYGFDLDSNAEEVRDTCRFLEVCARCSNNCDLPDEVVVENKDSVPFCRPIPTGVIPAEGATLQSLNLSAGYYRVSNSSHKVLECLREEACQGGEVAGDYCVEGYEGQYCSVCSNGFSPGTAHSCHSCAGERSTAAHGIFFSVLVVASALVVLVVVDLLSLVNGPEDLGGKMKGSGWGSIVFRLTSAVPLACFKVVVVIWQIISQFQEVTVARYPRSYEGFISLANMANLDVAFILDFACLRHTNFYDRLLFATLGPGVVLAFIGLLYVLAMRRNYHRPGVYYTLRRKHVSVALLVVFLVYAPVSQTILRTFVCEEFDNGVRYLRADYSLTCTSRKHLAFEAYAAIMAVVYAAGIPVTLWWWLYSYRHVLTRRLPYSDHWDDVEVFRDLWIPYKPNCYYYEIVEYIRRLSLTGLSVFIFPATAGQVAVVLLIATFFALLSEALSPFCNIGVAWLYRVGTCTVYLSVFLALALRVNLCKDKDCRQDIFAGMLVAVNVGLIVIVVGSPLQAIVKRRMAKVEEQALPRVNTGSRSSSRLAPGGRGHHRGGGGRP